MSGVFYVLNKFGANQVDYGILLKQEKIAVMGTAYELSKYGDDGSIRWTITKSDFWSRSVLEIDGFNNFVFGCEQQTLQIQESKLLCLKGEVGAHSMNIVLINLDTFAPIAFEGPEMTNFNIISDVPYYDFVSPGTLTADSRNYDKNPLYDSVRTYYLWKDGHFRFDKSEDITYDEKNLLIQGEI